GVVPGGWHGLPPGRLERQEPRFVQAIAELGDGPGCDGGEQEKERLGPNSEEGHPRFDGVPGEQVVEVNSIAYRANPADRPPAEYRREDVALTDDAGGDQDHQTEVNPDPKESRDVIPRLVAQQQRRRKRDRGREKVAKQLRDPPVATGTVENPGEHHAEQNWPERRFPEER